MRMIAWQDLVDHRGGLRSWLVAAQPEPETRRNWWVGLVLEAIGQVQSALWEGSAPGRDVLDLATEVIDIAWAEGALTAADAAIRLANLAGLIAVKVPPDEVPAALAPEVAVRRCLLLIRQDPQAVSAAASRWQTLPADRISDLRRIKNLLNPVLQLGPFLTARTLADEVAAWQLVAPDLP
jgi:hypothetical protein